MRSHHHVNFGLDVVDLNLSHIQVVVAVWLLENSRHTTRQDRPDSIQSFNSSWELLLAKVLYSSLLSSV